MRSDFLDINGVKTHVLRIGQGEQKIVFLHGWGGESKNFINLASALAKKNKIESLLIDLPGFGESDNPPPSGWSTNDYEVWLEEFLDKLKIKKASFYGHSFGCRIIIRLLLKAPHLADKVILTGAAGIKWPLSFRQKISVFLSKKFSLAKKIIPKKIQKIVMCRIFGARDWGLVSPELKSTLRKTLAEEDFRDELPKIKTPVFLIWGKNDSYTPLKSAKVFAEKLPNSRLKIFSDGRHGLHYTHEKKIVKLITEFLRKK